MCVKVERKWTVSKVLPNHFHLPQAPITIPYSLKRNGLLTSLNRSLGFGTQIISSSLLTTSKDCSLHSSSLFQMERLSSLFLKAQILSHCFPDTITFYPHSIILFLIPQITALLIHSLLPSNMQSSVSKEELNYLTIIFQHIFSFLLPSIMNKCLKSLLYFLTIHNLILTSQVSVLFN